jgi:hypothetical protein
MSAAKAVAHLKVMPASSYIGKQVDGNDVPLVTIGTTGAVAIIRTKTALGT